MVTVNSNSSSNSTQLVETVSIDYDDFNETFLTCATCLCVYDGGERTPKLLPCSHTVCVHCLTRIAAAANNRRIALDTSPNNDLNSGSSNILQSQQQHDSPQRQTFRCPICRELIVVPLNGGVTALPPSFLVNQLLDLISTHRRRTLIPTCCGGGLLSSHINQELLYCETCDQVFCSICTKHETATGGVNIIPFKSLPLVHTIIPVSVAMKRTSEILLYKANECVAKLNSSRDGVRAELEQLDTARNECLVTLDETFSDLINIIENRKQQLKQQIHKACDTKHSILSQQLAVIEIEKTKVMNECSNVHQLLDVRSINQQIQILNDRLQQPTGGIDEPRENAFITLDLDSNAIKNIVDNAMGQLGQVRTTTTCPGHCILDIAVPNGELLMIPRLVDTQVAILIAVDFDGNRRNMGGDPVTVKLIGPIEDTRQEGTLTTLAIEQQGNKSSNNMRIIDLKNGQYSIRLCLSVCGRYQLIVYVLGRQVVLNSSSGHISFYVTKNIDPLCHYNKHPSLQQPVAITMDLDTARVYVLDTGNCRIRVLDTFLNYICDVQNNEAMHGRSSTGIGLLSDKTLITVNWRTNIVTQMTLDGKTIKTWTHSSMNEPLCVAVDKIYDHVLIGDSSCNVHAFKATTGQHLFTINNKKSNGKSADCVGTFITIGPHSQIITISSTSTAGCRCLDVYSCKGTYKRSIKINALAEKSSHSYISLASCNNYILATRRYYNSYVIDLIDLNTDKLINTVDSNACKLRRPAGMVAFSQLDDLDFDDDQLSQRSSYYLLVTDVATDSIKKYQFL